MAVFSIRLAGLTVEMHSKYPETEEFCRDYLCESSTPDIVAVTDDEEIAHQRALCAEPVSEQHAEAVCLYRSIAEQLPRFDGFVFHGAAIRYGENGYLFTAPSGTGKTTHIVLWRALLGERVDIINGDKPIIRFLNGKPFLFSSPWAGKEGWQKNTSAPLGGICLLNQAPRSTISALDPFQHLPRLFCQIYVAKDPDAAEKTIHLVERLCKDLRLFSLDCNISKQAVRLSFEALTGKPFLQEENHDC